MRKLLLIFLFVSGLMVQANAQDRTVSGKVSSAEDNSTLPGVTVVLRGTTTGTTTDLDGNYKLSVPSEGGTLVYSFIGLATQELEIGARSVIDLVMQADAQQLTEVVVTALGISREKASLGYAVQEVSGDELREVPTTNVVSSLSGRVAGVQVNSSGSMGGSARIIIRGINSLTGGNQPLFVVDGVPIDNSNFRGSNQSSGAGGYDYGNAAQDINPNDIASMSVLKGAAAAALYGSRAANGVIIITTKRAKKGSFDVSVGTGVTFDKVFILPDYQNEYGGGGGGAFPGKNEKDENLVAYATDESWGAALDGTLARQWYSFDEGKPHYGEATPWVAHPNNVRDFFETGVTRTINASVAAGTETSTFRLGVSNLNQTGIMPNSELKRNTVSFSATQKMFDKLDASASGSFVKTKAVGRQGTGYSGQNVMQQFNQFGQRQWDGALMKDYKNVDGSQRTWNRTSDTDGSPKFTDNPYWIAHESFQDDDRTRFFGNIGLKYNFSSALSLGVRAMTDFYTDSRRERTAVGSQSTASYSEDVRFLSENNVEVMLNYNKTFHDISLTAFVGGNIRKNKYTRNRGATVDGLALPNLYTLSNSIGAASVIDDGSERRVNSLFGNVSLGYKGLAYLEAGLRRDESSTLPVANNSYYYPSVSGAVVLSELPGISSVAAISFAKVRVGWAQVGNDAPIYSLNTTFVPASQGFDGSPIYTTPNTLNNESLNPEKTNSLELGLEAKFLNNRVGFDVSVYDNKTTNQIIPVQVSATTGYGFQYVNSGLITNRGIEVSLGITPVKVAGLTWDVDFNWAKNDNKLVDLYTDASGNELETYRVTGSFGINYVHVAGESYGQLYGKGIDRNDKGEKIVKANGTYKATEKLIPLGSVLADWTGGVSSTLSYKGISLRALFSMQHGGNIFSLTNMWGKYSGILQETAADDVRKTGIIAEGVTESGEPNTTPISARTHFQNNVGYNSGNIQEPNVFDASYVKLKEVSVSYTLPNSLWANSFVKNVTVSVVGRNLALLHSNVPHIDPELTQNASNVQGIEGGQVPSTRSFGFNLKINF